MCFNTRSAENLVKGGDSSFHMQIIRASHWPEAVNLSDIPRTHLFPSIFPPVSLFSSQFTQIRLTVSISDRLYLLLTDIVRCFVNVTCTMVQCLPSCCTKSSASQWVQEDKAFNVGVLLRGNRFMNHFIYFLKACFDYAIYVL